MKRTIQIASSTMVITIFVLANCCSQHKEHDIETGFHHDSEHEIMSKRPKFDQQFAIQIIGKRVLVGITYEDSDEKFVEQKQFYGEVIRVDEIEGLVLRIPISGKELKLPPDFRNFIEAAPGEYRLRSTGEVIVDPDYTTTWTLVRPPPK